MFVQLVDMMCITTVSVHTFIVSIFWLLLPFGCERIDIIFSQWIDFFTHLSDCILSMRCDHISGHSWAWPYFVFRAVAYWQQPMNLEIATMYLFHGSGKLLGLTHSALEWDLSNVLKV